MSVPRLGTYLSSDQHFKIQIKSANPSNGQITGVYATNESPEGPFTYEGTFGHYAWVANEQGQAGQPPFNIYFTAGTRPDDFRYCIHDLWNGVYQADNSMLLAGTRAYVNKQGVVQVVSLGIQRFVL